MLNIKYYINVITIYLLSLYGTFIVLTLRLGALVAEAKTTPFDLTVYLTIYLYLICKTTMSIYQKYLFNKQPNKVS